MFMEFSLLYIVGKCIFWGAFLVGIRDYCLVFECEGLGRVFCLNVEIKKFYSMPSTFLQTLKNNVPQHADFSQKFLKSVKTAMAYCKTF